MKLHLIVGCALLALCGPAPAEESAAVRAEKYYRHGIVAENRGDAVTARKSFTAALQLNPGHANARYRLLQLKGNEGKLAGKSRELQLAQVKIPVVQFEDTTLEEVLETLDLAVRQQTKEKFSPNFVIQDSTGRLAATKVNIKVRNLPAKVVLQYALDQASAIARYDAHAVLIRPAKAAAPEPAVEKDAFPVQ